MFSLVISFLFTQNNFNPAYMASFGSVTIDGKLYNQISLDQNLVLIKLEWDLIFTFILMKMESTEKLDFTSPGASFKTLVDKIYYFRYGQVFDDLYFRIGAYLKLL